MWRGAQGGEGEEERLQARECEGKGVGDGEEAGGSEMIVVRRASSAWE